MINYLKKTNLFGEIIRLKKISFILVFLCSINTYSQYLHSSCDNGASGFIWSTTPSGNNDFDWNDGDLTKIMNNVDGSGVNITYTFTGETATLGQWSGSTSTTDSPAVGIDADPGEVLQFYTNGFVTGNGVTLTITFSAPVFSVGFDLFHINGNGTNGDKYTITATDNFNNTIFPSFTNSANPTYTSDNSTGVVNSLNNGSTAGDDDNIGVNFSDTDKIKSITIVWQDCEACTVGAVHGSGMIGFTFCENFDDVDGDGVPDNVDIDNDNDGILDITEGACPGVALTTTPDRITVADGATGTLQNIDVSSLGLSVGDLVSVSNVRAKGDIDGGTASNETFSLTFNGSTTDSGLYVRSTQCSATLDAAFPFVQRNLTVIDIGGGTPGITIQATTAAGVGNFCSDGSGAYALEYTVDLNCVTSRDSDGDGVPDYLDLDSDNDGIPDIIEAQSTTGYTPPTGLDSDKDGLDNAYDTTPTGGVTGTGSIGITPQNTDNTDNPDYLDLDSDNDGIFDIAESGFGLTDTAGGADGRVDLGGGTIVGTNGLVNSFDSGDDYTDPNGSFGDIQTNNNFTDSDNDATTGGDLDYRDIPGVDTDNDGIADVDDLDDDNDGILDVIENGNCDISQKEEVIILYSDDFGTGNARAESSNISNHFWDNDNDAIPDEWYSVVSSSTTGLAFYNRTETNGDIDANIDQFTGPAGGSTNGRYVAINMINTGNTEFYRQSLSNLSIGADYRFRVDLAGLCNGCADLPIFRLEIQPQGGGAPITTISSSTLSPAVANDDIWRRVILNFTATINNVDVVIYNDQPNGGAGNDVGMDNVVFGVLQCPTAFNDKDGDGIPNSLDLDSDNDGIPDVIESGGIDADRDGRADGTVGTTPTTNGIPSSAGTGNTPTATADGDTVPDYLDIDADNDGIPDNIEGQTTNGYVAPSGVGTGITDVNNNGVDDNYEVGGNIGLDPTNTDNIDNPDYQDTDADNDGILDVNENGDGDTFSATDTDGDGLVDVFDDNNDSGISGSTVNDGVTPTTTITDTTSIVNSFGDTDGDIGSGGNVDYRDTPGLDSDNDGIADVDDLDDDNDGILDTEENNCDQVFTYNFTDQTSAESNWNFSDPVGAGLQANNTARRWSWHNASTTSGGVGPDIGQGDAGYVYTEMSSPGANGDVFRAELDVNFDASDRNIVFSYYFGYRGDGNNGTIQLESNENGAGWIPRGNAEVLDQQGLAQNDAFVWIQKTVDLSGLISGNSTRFRLVITQGSNGTSWHKDIGLDSVTVSRCILDSDGDGIPNSLDLDSDNDGIPDVIESDGIDADRDGRADGAVGTGVSDNGVPISAGTGNTPITTDADSLPDYLDIDADNDGIPDNVEGQPTTGYVAPSGIGTGITDTNNNGVDDNYETGGFVGIDPENTDGTDNPDYIDSDSDNDGLTDLQENNDDDTVSGGDLDGDGLDNNFDDISGSTVNDNHNPPAAGNLGDGDNDATSPFGDLDYRDTVGSQGTPMITQVYQVGNERWIEITNVSTVNSIDGNLIKIQLYKNKTGDQTGVIPDVAYTVPTSLAPGKSILFKNASNVIANLGADASIVDNDLLTDIEGGDDIITLSLTIFGTSWADRYDAITSVGNRTSYVRIDETLTTNANYTPAEWVVFVDDALDPYRLLGAGGAERHPHDPLISEITGSNTDANTLLGLHRINITTRTGSAWNNGYPDRSRFVVIDEDYNHTLTRFSARKLTVNASRKLGITDSLLVVTNDVVLNGDIRLINSTGATGNSESQFIQTHTSASLVSGGGRLLVDQNSTVPSKYRYNYVGSPVKNSAGATDYTVASILKDGTNPTNFDGVINASTATGIAKDITFIGGFDGDFTNSPSVPIQLADHWMYTYAASGGTRASWDQKRSTGPIPNTDGFIFKGPGRVQNYTFMGTPKDGDITTTVGGDESYLVANPYASAISVKEFIEDNTNSITGTLYFWEHAGEEASSVGSEGHNFAGYIGGYATRTIATGVTAKNANSGPIDINLQAEAATITGGTTETVNGNEGNVDVVTLDAANESIDFKGITSGVDTLYINYKAASAKIIRIKENNVSKGDFTFPATIGGFNFVNIKVCVVSGSNITFESLDTNSIQIDYLNLKDDGEVTCAPNVGGDEITYTEPEPYIAIGQGFFVSGDADGGTITFNNSQREYKTEGTGSSVFLRSSTSSNTSSNSILDLPVVKLGMNFKDTDDGNDYHRQIAVSFSEFTSFDYDKGYDAEIYDIGATDFYWKFPNNEDKYVIAGVQGISSDLEVPLEIVMGYSGEVTIKVDEMKNINQSLYITDKVNNVSYEIINGTATLTLDQGVYSERFVLAFEASGALSVDDNVLNSFTNIYTDNKNKLLVITKNQEIDINKVAMYSVLGRKVSHWTIKEQEDKKQLKIQRELPTGVYIVKLNTNKGEISKKVIIE